MAPNIYNGDFHKTLYDVQEVIPKTTEINQKTFISRNRLYKLTEYQVVGSSSYNGFIQIEFYNFSEGLKDIYSYFEQNDFDPEEQSIRNIFSLKLPYTLEIVARYSFKNLRLSINGSRKEGKQIKGAYVDDIHNSYGLTSYAYRYLLNTYNLLISDNEQTLDGYGLWLNKISGWSRVLVYDIKTDEIICENLNLLSPSIFPWKLPDELDEIEHPLTKHKECKFYTVLFIMQ